VKGAAHLQPVVVLAGWLQQLKRLRWRRPVGSRRAT
jgi:hypothetical protein